MLILTSTVLSSKGANIVFPTVSVGASENILMAACLAKGETIICNAAKEPEIRDLSNCLVAMGANIEGIGTDKLTIRGKTSLKGADYSIVGDRIEAGTYAIAAAITGGNRVAVSSRRVKTNSRG